MSVAERMCEFIFMISKGKKVLDGTLESIQSIYGEDTLRIKMEGDNVRLDSIPGVENVTDFGKTQELRIARGVDPQTILAELMKRGRVRQFEQTQPSLHDIFVRIASPTVETHQ
jgi:ABC-2 type transport system ATP-binding protein